jgi:anti-sigma regulatory factor (Ser/Thr protein kinase)
MTGTGPDQPSGAPQLVHEALLYSTPEEFVAVAAPFLRDGLERDEVALVVTGPLSLGALRDAVADVAEGIDWRDTAAWHPKPVDRIRALDAYVGEALDRGVPRVRVIDELVWPRDSRAAVAELKRFESISNLLFAARAVWLVCPYNASLFNHILPDAYRTHPVVRDARVTRKASVAYLEPREFFEALDTETAQASRPADARVARFDDLRAVRPFVVAEATAAGLRGDRIRDLELAAFEMVTNAFRYGRQAAEVSVWTTPDELVCQVADTGGGMKDRLAGYGAPSEPALGGWGLLLARRLCDHVEVRTGPRGTIVRLSMRLPAEPQRPA